MRPAQQRLLQENPIQWEITGYCENVRHHNFLDSTLPELPGNDRFVPIPMGFPLWRKHNWHDIHCNKSCMSISSAAYLFRSSTTSWGWSGWRAAPRPSARIVTLRGTSSGTWISRWRKLKLSHSSMAKWFYCNIIVSFNTQPLNITSLRNTRPLLRNNIVSLNTQPETISCP